MKNESNVSISLAHLDRHRKFTHVDQSAEAS